MHTILPGHEISILSVYLSIDGCPVRAFNLPVTITAFCDGAPWIDCVRLDGIKPAKIIVNGCLDNISISSDNLPAGHQIKMRCS